MTSRDTEAPMGRNSAWVESMVWIPAGQGTLSWAWCHTLSWAWCHTGTQPRAGLCQHIPSRALGAQHSCLRRLQLSTAEPRTERSVWARAWTEWMTSHGDEHQWGTGITSHWHTEMCWTEHMWGLLNLWPVLGWPRSCKGCHSSNSTRLKATKLLNSITGCNHEIISSLTIKGTFQKIPKSFTCSWNHQVTEVHCNCLFAKFRLTFHSWQ